MISRSTFIVPKPVLGRTAPRPKLAATLVLLREQNGAAQILMGKRSSRHDFMPGVYVFPGGRVERADAYAPAHDQLNPRTAKILHAAMTPGRARACVMAALRETFEETALAVGKPLTHPPKPVNDPSWKAFYKQGFLPVLGDIEAFGRAVTPPHRDKRFDTWFFLLRLEGEAGQRPFTTSDELVKTGWFDFAQTKALKTHHATQMMIRELEIHLGADAPPPHVFFSRAVGGQLEFSRFPQQ